MGKQCENNRAGTKLQCNSGKRHAQGGAMQMGLQHCILSRARVGAVQRQCQPQTLQSCSDEPTSLARTQHQAGAGTTRSPAMLNRWVVLLATRVRQGLACHAVDSHAGSTLPVHDCPLCCSHRLYSH